MKKMFAIVMALMLCVGALSVAAYADSVDYYLFGYINGADYACNDDWENLGEYKFVDGELTTTFESDSYIAVKTGDNANWFMTAAYVQESTGTFINTSEGTSEKMFVPGGVELTFTLVENGDGSLTISYAEATGDDTTGDDTTGDDTAGDDTTGDDTTGDDTTGDDTTTEGDDTTTEGDDTTTEGGDDTATDEAPVLEGEKVGYYVTGSADFLSNWTEKNEAGQMTDVGDGICKIVFDNVPAGEYQLKVNDGTWANNWGGDGPDGNYVVNVVRDGYIVVCFNSNTGVIWIEGSGVGSQSNDIPETGDMGIAAVSVALLAATAGLVATVSKKKEF